MLVGSGGATVAGWVFLLAVLLLQIIEILQFGDFSITHDLNQTIIVGLVRIFVNQSTGEDTGHLSRIQRANLSKRS